MVVNDIEISKSQASQLEKIKSYIEAGNFELARSHLDPLENDFETNTLYKLKLQILKTRLLIYSGEYDKALALGSDVYKATIDTDHGKELQFESLLWCFEASSRQLDRSRYSELLNAGKELYQEFKNSTEPQHMLLLGYFNYMLSLLPLEVLGIDLLERISILKEGLKQFETVSDKFGIGLILNNLGYAYFIIGDMHKSIESHNKALEIRQQIDNKHQIAYSHANLGIVYRDLMKDELGYHHLNKALEIWQAQKNDALIAEVVWNLAFHSYLYDEDLHRLNEYYEECLKLDPENKHVRYYTKFIKALILKRNHRIHVKFQAIDILKTLIEYDFRYEYATLIQIELLTDILLDELKLYSHEEVLNEIKALMRRHFIITKKIQSFYYQVNSLLFQSKFALIEGDYEGAIVLLDQAYLITEKNKLAFLKNKVETEKQQLEHDFYKWRSIIDHNASIHERVEKTNIVSYLNIIGKETFKQKLAEAE